MIKHNRIVVVTALVTLLAIAAVGAIWWLRTPRFSTPMTYEALIRETAGDFDLSPAYVAAVILAESSFDPEAVSSADARGLMQLLPDTASWIAGKLGEPYAEEALFDPATNIRYGCWYLSFLMRRYHGDMRLSSAAYHAGQGNVDRWLQNPEYSDDGVTLKVIPYKSTEAYVNRVLTYCAAYAPKYGEERP